MSRLGRTALIRSFAALGVLVTLVTVTPLVGWWATLLAGPWNDPDGDVLIVLAGSSDNDAIMGQSSYLRSTYALMAYKQGHFRELVVSGGGSAGQSIAESMRDYLVCSGVPMGAIHVEPYARSTYENAAFTKPIVAALRGKKVLLTSDYHMARAFRTFRKAGVEVQPRPFPDVLKRSGGFQYRWGAFLDLGRETLALAYYVLRGWA
jgi:uncharacterized SAM-binding protein YcdF (DUF218 family)